MTNSPGPFAYLGCCLALVFVACAGGNSTAPDADTCPAPLEICTDGCTNTQVDVNNCGGCGTVCAGGQVCQAGQCVATCPAGQVSCAGQCVDPNTDRSYCGAGPDCVANPGNACDPGEICNGSGICELSCQSGLTDCSGTCVDTDKDRANCGGCGAQFSCGPGEICNGAGVCALTCQDGLTDCTGTCVDTDTDNNNCGGCGASFQCAAGQVCNGAGTCAATCQPGLVVCSNACVDPDNDPNYCGVNASCTGGDVCVAGEYCNGGTCEPLGDPACIEGSIATASMPPQTSTFGSSVRGYYFTAQSDFTITGVRVPDLTGAQSIQVMRFNSGPPPTFSSSTTDYTTLAYIQSHSSDGFITVCIPVRTGDIIGVLGQRGTTTSYGANPSNIAINGQSTTIQRLLYQGNINTAPAGAVSTESSSSLGRIEFRYAPGP